MTTDDTIAKFLENAKQNLVRDGVIYPTVIMLKQSQLLFLKHIEYKPDERYNEAYVLGHVAKQLGADTLIMISDAFVKEYKSMDEAVTHPPSSLPESECSSCIVAVAIDFPSFKASQRMIPYTDKQSSLVFENISTSYTGVKGAIPEAISKGWNARYVSPELTEHFNFIKTIHKNNIYKPPSITHAQQN